MELDNKQKSDMSSGSSFFDMNGATAIPDRPGTSPSFEPTDKGVHIEETKTAVKPATEPNPISQPVEQGSTSDSTEVLLKIIEKQLETLTQSVADLEQEVSSCKTSECRVDMGLMDKLTELETAITAVTEKQDRNDRQLAQTLRENANFQIQVRQGMQRDIDTLKEQQNGEQFNPILKELASMYVEYQDLLEDKTISGLSMKNLKSLFEQMEDLLFDYDAEIIRSEVGDTRQTKSTKIIGKVPTAEQDKHNTIAVSRKPGVIRGRTVLYPEFVDVFVYDPAIVPKEKVEIAFKPSGEVVGADQSEGKEITVTDADQMNV